MLFGFEQLNGKQWKWPREVQGEVEGQILYLYKTDIDYVSTKYV